LFFLRGVRHRHCNVAVAKLADKDKETFLPPTRSISTIPEQEALLLRTGSRMEACPEIKIFPQGGYIMQKRLLTFAIWAAVACVIASAVPAQDAQPSNPSDAQTSETQEQKKVWAVIEYPEGKEITVDLLPTAMMPEAKGTARILREGAETSIQIEMSGLTGDATSYNLYAVDNDGSATLLGAVPISEGGGSLSVKITLAKFMLVLSPESDLTVIGVDTPLVLRSSVPSGFEIAPPDDGIASEQGDEAHAEETNYDVPMLGIPSLRPGRDVSVRVETASDIEGVRGSASVKTQKGGVTQIKARLFNLPEGRHYILWAVSRDNTYTRLGRFVTKSRRDGAKLEVNVGLTDFGLFVTTEDADAPASPAGALVAKFNRWHSD
jgi:hypothetical protein